MNGEDLAEAGKEEAAPGFKENSTVSDPVRTGNGVLTAEISYTGYYKDLLDEGVMDEGFMT